MDSLSNVTLYPGLELNSSVMGDDDPGGNPDLDLIVILLTSVILGILILTTVIGNVFVIIAILLDRHLQSVANYLILSLAVADLLVALLVMPLGAVYEISQRWRLGTTLCDMWTCSDVLCCTASILHLLAIAVDRFYAVTQAHYIHSRNARNISVMIALVWIMSVVVSLAPLLGWKDSNWSERVDAGECMVSQDISYQIFATSATFFVPLILILILYWRIFVTARTRLRNRMAQKAKIPESSKGPAASKLGPVIHTARLATNIRKSPRDRIKASGNVEENGQVETTSFSSVNTLVVHNFPNSNNSSPRSNILSATTSTTTTTSTTNTTPLSLGPQAATPIRRNGACARHQVGGAANTTPPPPQLCNTGCQTDDLRTMGENPGITLNNGDHMTGTVSGQVNGTTVPANKPPKRKKDKKHVSLEAKREKKAAKTLAIVTGAFILCWLPFFVMALVMPLCEGCIDGRVFSFFLWLGYFNSTLNPIIYTVFSPEFRQAFKKLLCGRPNPENYRPRHLQ